MPAHRRRSSSSSRSSSRSRSPARGRRGGHKKAPSEWNKKIKKAMAQLKREGWKGDPKDRMRAAAEIAHTL